MSSENQNQTVINLIVNETDSQNFFTNLTKETKEKNIQINDQDKQKEILIDSKTNEMLERVNSNQKKIGRAHV